jgi:hypothetical protein
MSEYEEDSKEAVVQGIRKTSKRFGFLYPVLVEKGTTNILDGRTRKTSDPSAPEREIEIKDPKDRIAIPIIANYRRKVPKKETQGYVLQLVNMFTEEGVPDSKMVEALYEILPYSERYIRELLPSKYKRPKKPTETELVPFHTTEPESIEHESPVDATGIIPRQHETAKAPSATVCPNCGTEIETVQCPRCQGEIPVSKLKSP